MLIGVIDGGTRVHIFADEHAPKVGDEIAISANGGSNKFYKVDEVSYHPDVDICVHEISGYSEGWHVPDIKFGE